jgi:hypothetical protein
MHVEGSTDGQWPTISVFVRDDGTVRHFLTECASSPEA